MAKQFGTNLLNESFSDDIVQKVWEKGTIVPGYDPDKYRKDKCGAWMQRNLHSGNHGTPLSLEWEIDHRNPEDNGGTDDIDNLQPLQWENNRHKGTNYPNWNCKVTAHSTQTLTNKYT
ncbi:MAG: HNH endonuclease [Bacteroidia bacterium]|nr:HNH endonuclease [Bacteroidia bacterium]